MLIRNSIDSICTWICICSYIPKESKQDICIEWAFVSFVHYDSTVIIQVGLSQRFSQQNTIRHILNDSFLQKKKTNPTWITLILEISRISKFMSINTRTYYNSIKYIKIKKSTSDVQSSKRIAYPTSCPSSTPISSETRLATDMAATLLGWVQPTIPYFV